MSSIHTQSAREVNLAALQPGRLFGYLYDTGARGYTTCFAKVVRVGKKKVLVRFENGQERWKYPAFFDYLYSAEKAARLETEIVWR